MIDTTPFKAVELFCGIGGFRIATDRNSIETIWANDISPKACRVYRDQYGSTELHEGDIWNLIESVPEHDILTGGFPCQPFSNAGKKEGIRDIRGTLFRAIAEIIRRRRPQYFVLENVKRLLTMENGSHFATILACLSDLDYTIEWRLLNAMHFGLPQNRQRVFIVGTRMDKVPRNDAVHSILAYPGDFKGITSGAINRILNGSQWQPISRHLNRLPSWGCAREGRFAGADLLHFTQANREVRLKEILQNDVPKGFDFTESTEQWLPNNTPVNKFIQGVEILSNQAGGARMGYTIFGTEGVAPTLTSTTSRHYERYKIGDRYRRLTNVEYARIQGFPDSHCKAVSVYDQYAIYGNAVPPPMAEWVVSQIGRKSHELGIITASERQYDLLQYAY